MLLTLSAVLLALSQFAQTATGELHVIVTDASNLSVAARVEVLSDSTERYDRGVKMQHYRQIPTLAAVLLVSQHEPRIEVWDRGADDAWAATVSGPAEIATIAAIDCTLSVDDVYA